MLKAYKNYLDAKATYDNLPSPSVSERLRWAVIAMPHGTPELAAVKNDVAIAVQQAADVIKRDWYRTEYGALTAAELALEELAAEHGYVFDGVVSMTDRDARAEMQEDGMWVASWIGGCHYDLARGETAEDAISMLRELRTAAVAAQHPMAEICGFLVAVGMIAALGVCVSIIWRAYQVAP